MKKLSPFSARFVTNTFFPEFKDWTQEINQGLCFEWAYLAHRLYADTELWDVHCHAFIRYKGKFYDSERPDGVYDWHELPATQVCHCKWCAKGPKLHNELGFKLGWGFARRKYGLNWRKLNAKTDKILSEKQVSKSYGNSAKKKLSQVLARLS